MSTNVTPKLYIACLAAYNNGFLHGKWVNATQSVEDIWKEIHAVLKSSPIPDAEEWAVHDFEGFAGITISENPDLEEVTSIAQMIVEHGYAMNAFISLLDNQGYELDFDSLEEQFRDHYCGEWDSEKDFALRSDEIEELYNWAEFEEKFKFWSYHIDWESVAQELFMTDYDAMKVKQFNPDSHGIYVFRSL